MSLGLVRRPMGLRTSVASVAPGAALVLSPGRSHRGAQDGRALAAADAAGRARALAAARVAWPLIALIDWSGSTRGSAARGVTRRVLRASPAARMVALAAAAATVTAVATLALVVVAIAQLV